MFLNKLLIAVDDSVPSQYAIDVGLVIAQRDGCPVIFSIVLDPAMLAQNYGFASICELAEQIAGDILSSAMKRAADAGVQASSKVLYRDPARGIIELAKAEGVGMVAMGTHGRTGLSRALTGSVAEEVLRSTNTPLCVIRRPRTGIIYDRFLVPIAQDELSTAASEYATAAAKAFKSALLFCTVVSTSDTQGAEQMIDAAERHAKEHGVESQGVLIKQDGAISSCILKKANAEQCDAIFMASHGRNGFLRFVEGSVAEEVIRASDMPVVVIRR